MANLPTLRPASRRRFRTLGVATAALLALLSSGVIAGNPHAGGTPSARHAALDDDHLRHLVHHVMSRIDAPQQQQVMQVAHAAQDDLQALERRAQEARAPRARILLADVVDRGGLERIRTAEMRVADERSRRVDRLLVDIAAVLTPQQRIQLRAEMIN